jgi:hypothetical protein
VINIYHTSNGSTSLAIHQGSGDPTETEVATLDMANSMADRIIADLTNGDVTIHAEGVTP